MGKNILCACVGVCVSAANVKTLIIPLGSFVYFQIPPLVWFGIGAVFMLALAKGLCARVRVCVKSSFPSV